ncbi:uncharacterized protein SPAPADRAFT_68480 [Spathaspora passalidarum NRRL Y-27907]|uniref:Hyphally-regulated cell wall protein N-terminal domain-containing protein n=1 Tax=Spathaspora passalidarum (strain NRRL Y-27907 / 11-Y1) TaxID=619300 RepID=G3AU00_SPAPN|nr:uncharacterized protein SPAPADRAFT_68480 [Spathaspora passalidarum NRRL Y-27907]EGW30376.1 hypothetical protein SPAPADRAFT_68480 [Spathaspora passalidarum NRRL Y-27907]
MRLIIAITTWFLSGAIALDVSSTVTYTSTSVFFEPLHVSGILTLLDTVLFAAIPFTIDALAYFFLRNTSPSTIRTSDMVNNGYALFDVSGTNSVYIPFQNSNQNNGEFIVYGQHLDVAMYGVENDGSMTFWGDTGSVSIDGITNAGSICFHNQLGMLYRPGGKGSYTLSQSTVFANSVQSDFDPRITFEGSGNGFVNQNGDPALHYTLVNFGGSNYVSVPNQGYTRYTYSESDGIFTMFMSSNQIVFDIGLGYINGFNITITNAAPGTANQGGSVCELNLNPFGGGSTSSVEGSSSSEAVEPTSEESTEIETTSDEVETSTEVVTSTSDIEESTQGDTTIDEATSVVTTTDIDTTTPVVEESTTPEPASSEEETTSAVSSVTDSSSVGSSSSSTPRPPSCKKVNGKWKGNCPGHGHDNGNGHDHRPGKGHGNDHNNGHGNDHNNGHGNGHNNGHGNDHNNDHNNGHGNDHNNGHDNGHGNNNNGHNNGHGNDHGNNNNKGNNKNNNYDNGNGHGNDHDNKNGNSNGKGKGNDNKDNNGHGKGHKREAIQENSTSSANKRISMLLVIALFLTVII